MTKRLIIPWDLGATKCAMALVEYDDVTQKLDCQQHYAIKLADSTSLQNLIEQFESHFNIKLSDADAICIGAAGIYDGQELRLENGYPYPMPFAQIARDHHWPNYAVIHDYAPILCATFTDYIHDNANVLYLNSAPLQIYNRRLALGIGTGLGIKDGVLYPNGDFWLGENEAGHIGITAPPHIEKYFLQRHSEFRKFLLQECLKADEPLTFEKILSGQGLVRIHQFVDRNSTIDNPEQIGALATNGDANETKAMFAWYLGLFIGTMQLIFMPGGGIWISGGVALKHLDIFSHVDFTKGIEASPAYLTKRKTFPLAVMQDMRHAFFGGAYYAVRRLPIKYPV